MLQMNRQITTFQNIPKNFVSQFDFQNPILIMLPSVPTPVKHPSKTRFYPSHSIAPTWTTKFLMFKCIISDFVFISLVKVYSFFVPFSVNVLDLVSFSEFKDFWRWFKYRFAH